MDHELGDDLSFVIAFPLPFRVLFLAGIGILGWAANLHGLRLLGIDAAIALDLRAHEHESIPPLPIDQRPHRVRKAVSADSVALYSPVYHLALWYGLWCTIIWALYRSTTYGSATLVDFFKYIPAVCALVILIFMLLPYDILQKRQRDAFLL
jgi:EXS family